MVTEQNRRARYSSELDSTRAARAPLVEGPSISRAAFSLVFGHFFNRVYSYVSRRIEDRATCERVVREVLVMNLDLLVEGGDERQAAGRLMASSDRLIQQETAGRHTALELP